MSDGKIKARGNMKDGHVTLALEEGDISLSLEVPVDTLASDAGAQRVEQMLDSSKDNFLQTLEALARQAGLDAAESEEA